MPLLIAPVFNSTTEQPIRIELPNSYYLVSGAERPYEIASRYLRNEMDENKRIFDQRVSRTSLFLVAEHAEMKVTDDRPWIEEIENKLNLSAFDGTCSIPYVLTVSGNMCGITYLKRSIDGNKLAFDQSTQNTFLRILEHQLPSLAFRRYVLSLEKKATKTSCSICGSRWNRCLPPTVKREKSPTNCGYGWRTTSETRMPSGKRLPNSSKNRTIIVQRSRTAEKYSAIN